jgi:hypothetical protein
MPHPPGHTEYRCPRDRQIKGDQCIDEQFFIYPKLALNALKMVVATRRD